MTDKENITTTRSVGLPDWLFSAMHLAEKRAEFGREKHPCPVCGTEQVQLLHWLAIPQWKCRECGCTWTGNVGGKQR